MTDTPFKHDLFICHASDDKDSFVRPLAQALTGFGVQAWYDEFSLRLGDSLSRSISRGIAESRYGLVVISRSFMGRPWPEHELSGLMQRQVGEGRVILPIWYEVDDGAVKRWNPPLSDVMAVRTSGLTAQDVAIRILREVRPDIYEQLPRPELEKLASGQAIEELQSELDALRERLSEFQCRFCGSPLVARLDAPADPEEKHWDVRESFECGFTQFGGTIERPCPSDPKFPAIGDFDLRFEEDSRESYWRWSCYALPKTSSARLLCLGISRGTTKDEAEQKFIETYRQLATKWNASD